MKSMLIRGAVGVEKLEGTKSTSRPNEQNNAGQEVLGEIRAPIDGCERK